MLKEIKNNVLDRKHLNLDRSVSDVHFNGNISSDEGP